MSFGIRKTYFKFGNVKKEERKYFKFCRVKTVIWLVGIDLEEELAKGIKSYDRFLPSNVAEIGSSCQRSADLKNDGPVKGSTVEREWHR